MGKQLITMTEHRDLEGIESYLCQNCGYVIGDKQAGHCPECGNWFVIENGKNVIRYPHNMIRKSLKRIKRGQMVAGVCLLGTVFFFGIDVFPGFALCVLGLLACLIVISIDVFRISIVSFGTGYAIRHLILLWLLSVLLFSGLFAVPLLVKSDLMKYDHRLFEYDTTRITF
jgi:hypothetical protein